MPEASTRNGHTRDNIAACSRGSGGSHDEERGSSVAGSTRSLSNDSLAASRPESPPVTNAVARSATTSRYGRTGSSAPERSVRQYRCSGDHKSCCGSICSTRGRTSTTDSPRCASGPAAAQPASIFPPTRSPVAPSGPDGSFDTTSTGASGPIRPVECAELRSLTSTSPPRPSGCTTRCSTSTERTADAAPT